MKPIPSRYKGEQLRKASSPGPVSKQLEGKAAAPEAVAALVPGPDFTPLDTSDTYADADVNAELEALQDRIVDLEGKVNELLAALKA